MHGVVRLFEIESFASATVAPTAEFALRLADFVTQGLVLEPGEAAAVRMWRDRLPSLRRAAPERVPT
jgi:hypothetical protein